VVIAESFARIFRQNMFNCGMLAIELPKKEIDELVQLGDDVAIEVDLSGMQLQAKAGRGVLTIPFTLAPFDHALVKAGGWLAYADKKY